MYKFFYRFCFISVIWFLASCGPPVFKEKPLSLSDPLLKTCIFHPQTRIAHFPMYHFPPSGKYDSAKKERVSKSQFQLLHTILTYTPYIAVFEEQVTDNTFNPDLFERLKNGGVQTTYKRLDGVTLSIQERFNTANSLFYNNIPEYYEKLSEEQKTYLFQTGASWISYFLGHIQYIHKVVGAENLKLVLQEIENAKKTKGVKKYLETPSQSRDYYIFSFREQHLRFQVMGFLNKNPDFQGISLIAYGNAHNFTDDFSGYPFQEGKHCLQWKR